MLNAHAKHADPTARGTASKLAHARGRAAAVGAGWQRRRRLHRGTRATAAVRALPSARGSGRAPHREGIAAALEALVAEGLRVGGGERAAAARLERRRHGAAEQQRHQEEAARPLHGRDVVTQSAEGERSEAKLACRPAAVFGRPWTDVATCAKRRTAADVDTARRAQPCVCASACATGPWRLVRGVAREPSGRQAGLDRGLSGEMTCAAFKMVHSLHERRPAY